MIHPDTELRFISPTVGWGVVATRLIPAGTITWAMDSLDQILDPAFVTHLIPELQAQVTRYAYLDGHGKLVLSWDHARFVNHSCDPNCIGAWMDFEMAIRDIHPGEELTDDYGALNIETTFDCMCRTPQCRGRVSPEDVLQLWPRWDATLHQVIPTIGDVKQPLWNILTPEVRAEVENAIANPGMIPSVKGHFYPTQWSPVAPGGGNGSQPPAAIA